MSILTYLTGKFNTLTKLIALPRWLGPLITFIAIAINQALIELGVWPVQVAWLNLPVAFAATGGLRGGLVSAALVGAYSIWLDPHNFQRAYVVPPSVIVLAWLIGWQTRALRAALAQAEAERSWAVGLTKKLEAALEEARAGSVAVRTLNALNGNIQRLKQAKAHIDNIIAFDLLTDGTREKLGVVVHTLNNTIFATEGWVQLEEIRTRQAKRPTSDSGEKQEAE